MGFNPMFHTHSFMAFELRKNAEFLELAAKTRAVYFYGAGCSTAKLSAVVENALSEIFPEAKLTVEHDLTGAVYAACQGSPGIACILGTGSNSAYFDGKNINEAVPALGYIMGDEGSGSYFGKQLLTQYLYKQLPSDISEKFESRYPNLSREEIFERVYMKDHANVYLASFMKFLSDNREDPFVQKMVYKGLSTFIDIHIWQYKGYKEVPVHFVGSIAFYFENLLRKVAGIHHLNMGRIIRKPVVQLLEHHL